MMKKHKKKILIIAITAIMLGASVAYSAGGSDPEKELFVYSIGQYDELYDSYTHEWEEWKVDLSLGSYPLQDPYQKFWEIMYTNCFESISDPVCAHTSSIARSGDEVSVDSMAQHPDGWEDADMVFFEGHVTQIQPQWEYGHLKVWRPVGSSGWYQTTLSDWQPWGTSSEPYRYHRNFINDASLQNAYAIFYAYNPLTSILIGEDFTSGTWYTENEKDGDSTAHTTGKLGYETEWVVANGCNAVTTAYYFPTSEDCDPETVGDDCNSDEGCWDGKCQRVVGNALGVSAWSKSWYRLHLVLGHYRGTDIPSSPDLQDFGIYLKTGDTIKDAYFDAHQAGIPDICDANETRRLDSDYGPGYCQPSIISQSPDSCCYPCGQRTCCPTDGCDGDFLHHDTWRDPDPDLTDDFYYTTVWAVMEY